MRVWRVHLFICIYIIFFLSLSFWPIHTYTTDQRHDLFITGGPTISGFLAGPTSNIATAGYLMVSKSLYILLHAWYYDTF